MRTVVEPDQQAHEDGGTEHEPETIRRERLTQLLSENEPHVPALVVSPPGLKRPGR